MKPDGIEQEAREEREGLDMALPGLPDLSV